MEDDCNKAFEDDPDLLRGDRNEEFGEPSDLVREGKWEAENRSDLGEERDREDLAPVMVSDRVEESGNDADSTMLRNLGSSVLRERKRDVPPDDDCCPICFGDFEIPCKTSCGHWFCASCILTLWNYRGNALWHCQCPICFRQISKLVPEASLLSRKEKEVVEALKKVQRYNCLFVGGALGLIMKLDLVPLFFWRFFQGLLDPRRIGTNYNTLRLTACFLALIYWGCGFDFIPIGRTELFRVFDLSATALGLVLLLAGYCRQWILRRRARLLAAPQQGMPRQQMF